MADYFTSDHYKPQARTYRANGNISDRFFIQNPIMAKLIMWKYGYLPDLQDTAGQTVLQQAEALSSGWILPRHG